MGTTSAQRMAIKRRRDREAAGIMTVTVRVPTARAGELKEIAARMIREPDILVRVGEDVVVPEEEMEVAREEEAAPDDKPKKVKLPKPASGSLTVRYYGRDIWPWPGLGIDLSPEKYPTHADVKVAIGITRYLMQVIKGTGKYDAREMPLHLRRIGLMLRTVDRPEAAARLISAMSGAVEAKPDAEMDERISPQFLGSFTA